ncbi:MAG: thiamine phosphate synthase [Bacteroidales bacterium]|jgi:thiamine-phosphate pyrophosphorylase|nr:thiamine phosphate synthase [Bacteroidales bacterium]
MRKIIITYPTNFEGEIEQILSVLEDKKVILHLRKPDASEEVYEEILDLLTEESIRQIVLHDYYHLTENYAVAGIHLSTKKREQGAFIKSTNQQINKLTISTSTHSIEELRLIDGQFDYAFLSPIFPSISKQGYEGNLDMQEVESYLRSNYQTKVIALGGIDNSNIKQLKEWGFDGHAQLGSIWKI